jgi:hypothetical protein
MSCQTLNNSVVDAAFVAGHDDRELLRDDECRFPGLDGQKILCFTRKLNLDM